MAAFKKPGRSTRDRKPDAMKVAAEKRAAAAEAKLASGNTSTKVVRRQKVAPKGATITVTQVRSEIGGKPKTRATLRALGLRRIGHTNTVPDRPETRGMIARVPHLIEIKEGK
ncbi:MAG: 50S ribosomal protein L30 [Actinomycetota bacterium]